MSDHYCCKRCGLRYADCTCSASASPTAASLKTKAVVRPAGKFDRNLTEVSVPAWAAKDEATLTALAKKKAAFDEWNREQLEKLIRAALKDADVFTKVSDGNEIACAVWQHVENHAALWISALQPFVKPGGIE